VLKIRRKEEKRLFKSLPGEEKIGGNKTTNLKLREEQVKEGPGEGKRRTEKGCRGGLLEGDNFGEKKEGGIRPKDR